MNSNATVPVSVQSSGLLATGGGQWNLSQDAMNEKSSAPENCYTKTYSKSILEHKINEYEAGKLSKAYIDCYLQYIHFEGIITNLEYLKYKSEIK